VRADIRGRQIALIVALGLPGFALSALMMALTGVYEFAVPIFAVLVATLGAGTGIAVVMSVVGVTPGVDPHRRVNATDAGENGFAITVALHLLPLFIAPTAAMAAPLAFDQGRLPPWFAAATLAVALGNAVVVAWAGGTVAVRRLDSHLPETFARLRYPGTATATTKARGGGGLLDYLSGQAENAALTTAAAAKGSRTAERTKETAP